MRLPGRHLPLLQLVISLAVSFVLLYPNLSAKWGLTDDHEVINFLGPDGRLEFSEIPGMLLKTEAGLDQTWKPRYRPSYYSLRLVEASAWGDNPFLWYAFRNIIFGFSVFLFWRVLGNFFGIAIGGLATLLLIENRYWADIFTRLGPSEIYCTLGFAIYAFSFMKVWDHNKKSSGLWWLALAAGLVIAAGSKENFLFLFPVSVFLYWRRAGQNGRKFMPGISIAAISVFSLFVSGSLLYILSKNGADVYGQPVGITDRLNLIWAGLGSSWPILIPFGISLVWLGIIRGASFIKPGKIPDAFRREQRKLFYIQGIFLLFWYSQYLFYNGDWPKGNRYDFPGVLAEALAYFFLLYWPLHMFIKFGPGGWVRILRTSFICLCLVFLIFRLDEFRAINKASRQNSVETGKFYGSLLALVSRLNEAPERPLIMESNQVWDYEPVFSLRKYLSARQIKNPLAFRVNWSVDDLKGPLEREIAGQLKLFSEKPEAVRVSVFTPLIPVYPLGQIYGNAKCFAVSFSGPSKSGCEDLGRIYP